MNPTKELADAIYREKVLRARATPPEQKVFTGAELFDNACGLMRDGIRDQFPDADEQRVEQILRERLVLARKLEQF